MMETTAETPEFVAGAGLLGLPDELHQPEQENAPEAQEAALLTDSEGADCD